jgi:hypothetical protein
MNETLIDRQNDTVAVTRNPEWLSGKDNTYPFCVSLVFGDFKQEHPQVSFDVACETAERISDDYHVNWILEQGLDPEFDAFYWVE